MKGRIFVGVVVAVGIFGNVALGATIDGLAGTSVDVDWTSPGISLEDIQSFEQAMAPFLESEELLQIQPPEWVGKWEQQLGAYLERKAYIEERPVACWLFLIERANIEPQQTVSDVLSSQIFQILQTDSNTLEIIKKILPDLLQEIVSEKSQL